MPIDWNVDYNDRRESPGSRRKGFISGFKAALNIVKSITDNDQLSDSEKLEKLSIDINNTFYDHVKMDIEIRKQNEMVINRNAFD